MKKMFLIFFAVMSVLLAGCKVVNDGCDFSAAPPLTCGDSRGERGPLLPLESSSERLSRMICAYSSPRSVPTQQCDMCLTADREILSAA